MAYGYARQLMSKWPDVEIGQYSRILCHSRGYLKMAAGVTIFHQVCFRKIGNDLVGDGGEVTNTELQVSLKEHTLIFRFPKGSTLITVFAVIRPTLPFLWPFVFVVPFTHNRKSSGRGVRGCFWDLQTWSPVSLAQVLPW